MWKNNPILDLLDIEHPIIQAPMAGATNPRLIAAVCEAGGLGGLGAAGLPPDLLRSTIREIRALTDRPFNVNLFNKCTEEYDSQARLGPRLTKLLETYHSEMGLGPIPDPIPFFGPANDQLEVLIEEKIPVISFHFGADGETVAKAKQAGAKILSTATTLDEARLLEKNGVDAIIAQGAEAGGHRGTFLGDYREALIGTLVLVPRLVDEVPIPVIATGGIMDARGIVACLALGASAVQMGTAFLGCPESTVTPAWRDALTKSEAEGTKVTEVISGKPARGIRNRYINELEAVDEPLLPYPSQFSVSRNLRNESARRGDPSLMAMWAGQGVGLLTHQPAAVLVNQLIKDTQQLISRLAYG